MDASLRINGIRTKLGRVNYNRKKRYFKIENIPYIMVKITNRLETSQARETLTATRIRETKILADNLYHFVWDLFDNPLPDELYQQAKEDLRFVLDNFVEIVALGVTAKTGSVPAGNIISTMGRWVNRAAEYIFTGSTGL